MIIKIKGTNDGQIQVNTPYDPEIISIMRAIPHRTWDKSACAWFLPDDQKYLNSLLQGLYNTGRFTAKPLPGEACSNNTTYSTATQTMLRELKLKGFSRATLKIYKKQIESFFSRTGLIPEDTRQEDIKIYLEKLNSIAGCSRSYAVQCISALKNFYRYGCLKSGSNPAEKIPLPKKEQKYPDILSREEVRKIIHSVINMKHRFLLMLTYSAGLRVSEVVKLRCSDLDFDRMMIHIRQAKGYKDRYVIFSQKALECCMKYRDNHIVKEWLFAGANTGDHLSIRSAQKVFERSAEKAGIIKNVSIHSLRHAFATHLLEDGVDLRYIQELLGHKSSRTTEVYTHVTKADIRNIKSPLDRWE